MPKLDKLYSAIRLSLSDDLRKPKYKGHPDQFKGHCYVASEVAYHALGGKENGWKPMHVKHEGEPHWFIQHQSGTVFDPTASQLQTPVPYDKAKGKGFLTKKPSKRAMKVIRRIHHLITEGVLD